MYDTSVVIIAPMAKERKTARVSARLPASLVDRADFVARNDATVRNRNTAIERALADWLPKREQGLIQLGLTPPHTKKEPRQT
jgi:hypothetical protein